MTDAAHEAIPIMKADYEALVEALKICNRVLHFDLRRMITWGPDYNQAVTDAAKAVREALAKVAAP